MHRKKPAGMKTTGRKEIYAVSYEIQEAAEDVKMTRKELRKFLKANGGGKLTKDKGEFEDDYASDSLDFLRRATISWEPLKKEA
ncbi:MAG: hypothetical protein LYZ70_04235 [Nitrososphaerales archaeon]|nr:hypothetical protein [Nitrososphaerales archaeon]